MCEVRNIEDCRKKVYIYLQDGTQVSSDWFEDNERKNTCGEDRFTMLEKENYDRLIADNRISPDKIDSWSVGRDKDPECVYISRHAFDRMKERNGWNRKTSVRMVRRIYDCGILPDDVHGPYRNWVQHRKKKDPKATYRFYGQNLYVFDNNVLITVIQAKQIQHIA